MTAAARPLPAAANNAPRSSIAVVDDDAGFGEYLRTLLAVRGYDAQVYERGETILAAIRHGACPDVVLLDVAMPGMDGLQTLKALKHARPDQPVIMLSGREQANTIVEAVHLGAADYVVKPADLDGLRETALEFAITQAIDGQHPVTRIIDGRRHPGDEQGHAVLAWRDSAAMRPVVQIIDQVADTDVTVLIRGESGVGKELVARGIHHRSARRRKPFVKVNCAALPAELLESELFGHEAGAFTGAAGTRIGMFEEAHLGTILLDEIGEMRPALQAKLLQVLQDREFTRLGGNRTVTIDVRVLAATNRNLEEMIRRGDFREDLYHRLRVIETTVPPLRERRDEVLPLTDFFIAKYTERYGRSVHPLSPEVRQLFQVYDWPGNVRELENMIKRFVILQDEPRMARELGGPGLEEPSPRAATPPASSPVAAGTALAAAHACTSAPHEGYGSEDAPTEAPVWSPMAGERVRSLAHVARQAALAAERDAIAETLRRVRWNRREAAEILGVCYKTLLSKIKDIGIERL